MLSKIIKLLTMSENDIVKYIKENVNKSKFNIKVVFPYYIQIQPKNVDSIKLPTLSAHIDIVGKNSPTTEELDVKNTIISLKNPKQATRCLGGDDRCGVFILTELLKKEVTKYNYLFFFDEEIGCIGSSYFADTNPNYETSCFIGLDRESKNHIATYGVDSNDLIEEFEEFGYHQELGSITDVSVLAKRYNIPCINLSIGYYNQHTKNEWIDFKATQNTLKVMEKWQPKKYEYIVDDNFHTDFEMVVEPFKLECEICGSDCNLYMYEDTILCEHCLNINY